jgi:hypothetical protein
VSHSRLFPAIHATNPVNVFKKENAVNRIAQILAESLSLSETSTLLETARTGVVRGSEDVARLVSLRLVEQAEIDDSFRISQLGLDVASRMRAQAA